MKVLQRIDSRTVLGIVGAIAIGACATSSTTLTSSWKNPEAKPADFQGRKVAAVYISPNESSRRAAEDKLAAEITRRGAVGVPVYTLLSTEELKNTDASKAKLTAAGITGVICMRVSDQKQEVTVTPGYWSGGYYGGGWGPYWGHGWGMAYSPGYMDTDTIISVETLIYSLEQDKLLWAGMSETVDPSKLDSFIAQLASAIAVELKKQGLLA